MFAAYKKFWTHYADFSAAKYIIGLLVFVLDGLFYPIRTFRLLIKVNSINCCSRQVAIIFSYYSLPYSIIFWFY